MNINNKLTVKNILNKVDEQVVFQFYYPYKIVLRKNIYKSPFRIDRKKGSCHFNWYKGRFYFFDKAIGKTYDVFDYLMFKYKLSFYETLCKINIDFSLGLNFNVEKVRENILSNSVLFKYEPEQLIKSSIDIQKSSKKFKVNAKRYNKEELYYWNDYNIDINTLKKYKVNSVREYLINYGSSWKQVYSHSKDDFCFCYTITSNDQEEPSIKLYRPLNKKYKWFSSIIDNGICHGYEQLSDRYNTLIITSSLKEVMVLSKMGIDACCPITESSYIDKSYISEFKNKYDNVFIMYDRDKTGLYNNRKHSTIYDVNFIDMPYINGQKDISDGIKHTSFAYTKDKIQKVITANVKK